LTVILLQKLSQSPSQNGGWVYFVVEVLSNGINYKNAFISMTLYAHLVEHDFRMQTRFVSVISNISFRWQQRLRLCTFKAGLR